jgi:hypothetical protein
MSNYRKIFLLIVAMVFLIVATSVGAQQDKPLYPVGSISFESTSIAAGVGVTWGKGTFTFEGKKYSIEVKGLKALAAGVSKVNAVADVYNLTKASDVAGTYVGISGGVAIVGGVKGILARNEYGVVIDLRARQQGVSLDLGAEGFTISIR